MKNRLILLLVVTLYTVFGAKAQNAGECKRMHLVAKKETVYGISHQYGLTEDELLSANPKVQKKGLKKGEYICIPYSTAEIEAAKKVERDRLEAEIKAKEKKAAKINLAVILPFGTSKAKLSAEAQRMIDFYRGVLMVADSLKKAGVNLNIQAYDEENLGMSSILQKPALKNADIIFGPGSNVNVDALAAFANQNQILLVVPFCNRKSLSAGRRFVFQTNPLISTHYDKVFNQFSNLHRNDNIIFIGMGDSNDNAEYIIAFKGALEKKGIKYSRLSFAEMSSKLPSLLSTKSNNIIIPSASNAHTFDNICAELNEMNLAENCQIQLFGYPEWQSFYKRSSANMAKYRIQFYTPYYHNIVSSRTKEFNGKFSKAFHSDPVASYPRFAEMGHDIAAYFLTGIQRYGKQFTDNVSRHDYNSIHQPYKFLHTESQGGYTNSALYIITYKTDGNIQLNVY